MKLRLRDQRGHTLIELMVTMVISVIFLGGLMGTWRAFTVLLRGQSDVSEFQAGFRGAIHQIARDLRASGANPTANPYLFDNDPPSDTGLELDPDGDGDIHNAVLVRMDTKGAADSFSDGDANDLVEIVYYHYLPSEKALFRHTWRLDPIDALTIADEHVDGIDRELIRDGVIWTELSFHDEMFLADVCDFSFDYFDRAGQPTTDATQVLLISINVVAAPAPGQCDVKGQFTRPVSTAVRLRNR